LFLLVSCILATGALGQMPTKPLLFRDVRVFDGKSVLEHRSVLVENGKIIRIAGANFKSGRAEVIDGRGRTLLPGLFDAHVHVPDNMESSLHQAIALGVTTVLDMFTSYERLKKLKQIEADDPPDIADVRTAGIGATAPGGHPTEMDPSHPIPTITSPEQAQAFVDARIAEGSDYIKIIYDGGRNLPTISKETLAALVKAAHRRGKLVVVHALSSEEYARGAIEAGADGLAHMFIGESASEDFGQFATKHHVFIIATLSTLYSICGMSDGAALLADPHLQPFIAPEWRAGLTIAWPRNDGPCKGLDKAMREVSRTKVPMLAGTDAPVPGSTYGASVHGELVRLVNAGYTPVQALASATSIPARIFHLNDRGYIRTGMRADLVLVEGDPTQNILATRNIIAVFKKGVLVHR
jgi:imidazolonepropionase-like amidohydrolase